MSRDIFAHTHIYIYIYIYICVCVYVYYVYVDKSATCPLGGVADSRQGAVLYPQWSSRERGRKREREVTTMLISFMDDK